MVINFFGFQSGRLIEVGAYLNKYGSLFNNVISFLSCKDGYEDYTKWKYDWSTNGQREASIKVYVSEMVMPFWIQCTLCSKWREFPEKELKTAAIKSWKCTSPTCVITSESKVTKT